VFTFLPECRSASYRNAVQIHRNTIVRSNIFSVQGTITTTDSLERAALTATGSGGTQSLDLLGNGTIAHNGGAFSLFWITDLLFLGSNKITISAQDCKNSGENSTTVIFQPCDGTTNPKVTIIKPDPAGHNNVVSSDIFVLKGKIDSAAPIDSVR